MKLARRTISEHRYKLLNRRFDLRATELRNNGAWYDPKLHAWTSPRYRSPIQASAVMWSPKEAFSDFIRCIRR